ncbi:MAG: LacI family DNA-binding transcriptional regulator [Herpetosiphonaceae bacterium]|nr:LacI family DNA-binding transcriptional regulator [Herpetosiphonaceae bacterium]
MSRRAKGSNNGVGRPVTSIEVARLAGVSQSTVSRVFSANNLVADETSEKVVQAARTLRYKPNAIARSLITRRTDMIGIVMAEITSPFYPYVLEKFTQRLHELGKSVLLFTTGPGSDVDETLQDVLKYQVDGLIVANATLSSTLVSECGQRGTPLMLFNRYVRGAHASAVCCDNVAGGQLVAEMLSQAGHRQLAYIAGKHNTSTNVDRERGFSERLQELEYGPFLREQGEYTYQSGYEAAKRLLQRDDPPDGIFCANDIMALGALDAARDLRVKVPDELSVIGFDDIPAASWTAYSLTTVRQPVNTMIGMSTQLLLERIASPEIEPVVMFVPGKLVQRGSARVRTE